MEYLKKKLRTLDLGGKVTSLRFTAEEWDAIDTTAAQHGKRWKQWARELIESHPEATNRAGLLRRAALETLYANSILAERAEAFAGMRYSEHPMLHDRFWALSAADLEAELAVWEQIDQRVDFYGYELICGHRGGVPVIVVRSKLEGDLSALLLRDPMVD